MAFRRGHVKHGPPDAKASFSHHKSDSLHQLDDPSRVRGAGPVAPNNGDMSTGIILQHLDVVVLPAVAMSLEELLDLIGF